MNFRKCLGRRGLAFLLTLTMCAGIPRFPAYAEEPDSTNEIQIFLDAVNAIEIPEEDLLLEENASLAQTFGEAVSRASEMYENLSEEKKELEEVNIAYMELNNMAAVLSGGIETMEVYGIGGISVRPDYDPNGCVPGISKFGGSVTKNIGENGFYKRRAVHNFFCPTCGWFFGQSSAKEYANIQWEQDNDGVISDVSFQAGALEGYPCLEMDFTGARAGTTLVTMQYDVNFHTRWNSGYAACPSCGTMTSVQQYDDNWYHYEDQFYVTVVEPNAEVNFSGNEHWVFVPSNAKADEVAEIEIIALDENEDLLPLSYGNPIYVLDPNGVNGEYANITSSYGNWDTESMYHYSADVKIKGLKATSEDKPVSVYVKYTIPEKWRYDSWYGDWYVAEWKWCIDKINVIVYDPGIISLPAGTSERYEYGRYIGNPDICAYDREAYSTNTNILALTTESDYYEVKISEDAADGSIATTKLFYSYYNTDSEGYSTHNITCWVDIKNFVVDESSGNKPTTTPVTIVKEFNGIAESQIPNNFSLTYKITGCNTCGEKTGTLEKADGRLTNTDGIPRILWDVDLPVAVHGNMTHTISFTETNANVADYQNTMSGQTVTLEQLETPDGAPAGAKPVITVVNTYTLNPNVYELRYDMNGGTGGPAVQAVTDAAESHTFQVAGDGAIPTNGDKVFKGWSETLNGSVDYVYTVTDGKGTFTPAEVTLQKPAPSKVLYAAWGEKEPETTQVQVIKKFEGIDVDEIPENFKLSYTVNDEESVLTKENADSGSGTTTLKWKISIPKGTRLSFEEENADVDGKTLAVAVKGALAESVTVGGEKVTPLSAAGYSPDSDTAGAGDEIRNLLSGDAERGFVSGSASTTVTVIPSITITNSYTDNTTIDPGPVNPPVEPIGNLTITKKVNGNGTTSESAPEAAEKKDDATYIGEYTVIVTNKANVTLGAIRVVDEMASNLKLEEVTGVKIGNKTVAQENIQLEEADNKLTWTIEGVELEPDEQLTIMYTASMPAGENALRNTVRAKAKQAVQQEEQAMFKARAISDDDFGDDWGFDSGDADAWIKPGTGSGGGENPAPGEDDHKVVYTVRWIDKADNHQIKAETRGPVKIGTEVSVLDTDKIIEGYTFDEDNEGNRLKATLEKSDTVLILYFAKNSAPDSRTVTVTWLKGYEDETPIIKQITIEKDGDYSGEYPEDPEREGWKFIGWGDPKEDEDGNIAITARWEEAGDDDPDKPVDPEAKEAAYTVDWYDAETGEKIQKQSIRRGKTDETVSVTGSDKTVKGYTYKSNDSRNVESAVLEERGTSLCLYFIKDEEPEKPDKKLRYRIIYYRNHSGEDETVLWRETKEVVASSSDAERDRILTIIDDEPSREGYSFDSWGAARDDEMSSGYTSGMAAPWQEARKADEETYELRLYAYWLSDEPANPDTPGPEEPGTDNPGQGRPDNPDSDQPGSDNPNPGTPDDPNPGTPDDSNPGTPDNPNPGIPDDSNPDTPDNPIPDNPDTEDPKPPTSTSGGSNGGSGGSGGSRRTGDSDNGPGTAQINEEEVPLAALPESAADLLAQIDDDDVPLAGLPKTGQERSAAKMMLFLSGAVLAVYASLFRKEEEE